MKKKILVYALNNRRGGIEVFFINFNKYFKNIQLDFIKLTPDHLSYENELANSRFYYVPTKKENPILRRKKITQILNQYDYDGLWFNGNDLASVDIVKKAKKLGIKCIGHAHNSRTSTLNRTIRHNINKKLMYKKWDGRFACSTLAAKWFYPHSM